MLLVCFSWFSIPKKKNIVQKIINLFDIRKISFGIVNYRQTKEDLKQLTHLWSQNFRSDVLAGQAITGCLGTDRWAKICVQLFITDSEISITDRRHGILIGFQTLVSNFTKGNLSLVWVLSSSSCPLVCLCCYLVPPEQKSGVRAGLVRRARPS